jgi:hypothetical protein
LERRKPSKFQFSVGVQGGIALKTLFIDQKNAEHNLRINQLGKAGNSYFYSFNTRLDYDAFDWMKVYTALSIGVYKQTLQIQNTAKNPTSYKMEMRDSLNFTFSPNWLKLDETRTQELIFSNIEIGVKPLIFKNLDSGPFASLVVWAGLSEKTSSTLDNPTSFRNAKSRVSISYKFGYEHMIAKSFKTQVFVSPLPSEIISSTPGLSVLPNLVGIGISYVMR